MDKSMKMFLCMVPKLVLTWNGKKVVSQCNRVGKLKVQINYKTLQLRLTVMGRLHNLCVDKVSLREIIFLIFFFLKLCKITATPVRKARPSNVVNSQRNSPEKIIVSTPSPAPPRRRHPLKNYVTEQYSVYDKSSLFGIMRNGKSSSIQVFTFYIPQL